MAEVSTQDMSEAIVGIGLVADEVGPKKLKTSEYHQPGPATEYLLGVVRGVGGTKEGAVTGGVIRQTEMSSQQTKTVIEVHTVRDGRPGWKSSQADITDGVPRAVPSPLETKPSKQLTSNQQTKTVLDVHSVGGGRSGWKSSQADITNRVSGAVPSPLETQPSKQLTNLLPSNPGDSLRSATEVSVALLNTNQPGAVPQSKVCLEGGGCVNTQTGYVGVAAPQSNIVLKDNKEGGASVNTQTGCVRVAASQSNIVFDECELDEKKCVSCAKLKSVRCRECVLKSGCVVRNVNEQFERGEKPCQSVKMGKRTEDNITRRPSGQKSSSNSISISNSSSQSTSRLKNYFSNIASKNTNFVGKVGHGENIKHTPVKRKLIIDRQVSQLVSKFDQNIHHPEVLPGFVESESESPAKRLKQMPGVKHPFS